MTPRASLSLRSQPTKEPPGVHQSLRGEAARQVHLRTEGGSTVPPRLHHNGRDWWVSSQWCFVLFF